MPNSRIPGVTFRYTTFQAISDQVNNARVYGGIHVREDQEVGRKLGRAVGGSVDARLSQAG
jgi:hypothetical protein